jgi:hypothetical protein
VSSYDPERVRDLLAEADMHMACAREHQRRYELSRAALTAAMDQAQAAWATAERSWDAYLLRFQPDEWAARHGLGDL